MGKRKREREGDEKKRRKRRRAERDVAGPASTKKQTQQAKNSKSKPGKEMQAGEAKPGKKAKAGKARRQVEGRAVAEQVTLRGMSEIRRFFRAARRRTTSCSHSQGRAASARTSSCRRPTATEDEAFYLRIATAGGYRYPGADIGILVTRGRLQTDDHELTDRARTWIVGIKKQFSTVKAPAETVPVREPDPFSFKML